MNHRRRRWAVGKWYHNRAACGAPIPEIYCNIYVHKIQIHKNRVEHWSKTISSPHSIRVLYSCEFHLNRIWINFQNILCKFSSLIVSQLVVVEIVCSPCEVHFINAIAKRLDSNIKMVPKHRSAVCWEISLNALASRSDHQCKAREFPFLFFILIFCYNLPLWKHEKQNDQKIESKTVICIDRNSNRVNERKILKQKMNWR